MIIIHRIVSKMNIKQLKTIKQNYKYKKNKTDEQHNFLKAKKDNQFKKKFKAFIVSTPFSIFMSVLTIYTIFAIDIDKAFFTVNASFWFSIVHVLSMAIFITQTFFLAVTEEEYIFSFYFWIDIFSTLTMMLEVIWIEDLMNSVENLQMAISIARISKASRFSKIGARSTKIMKLVRLIKLMKFMRNQEEIDKKQQNQNKTEKNSELIDQNTSYNQMYKKNDHLTESNYLALLKGSHHSGVPMIDRPNVDIDRQLQIQRQWEELNQRIQQKDDEDNKDDLSENTKVGKILKDQIQKNIVILVMGVIIFVPMLTADTWFNKTTEIAFVVDQYMQVLQSIDNETIQMEYLDTFIKIGQIYSSPLIEMAVNITDGQTIRYPDDFEVEPKEITIDDLRQSDKTVISQQDYRIVFNKIELNKVNSYINMGRSMFITFLLILASILFIRDIDNYALIPLQKMSVTVDKINQNPFGLFLDKIQRLIALKNTLSQEPDNQNSLKQQLEIEQIQSDILPTSTQEELETNLLEKLLIKISFLLSIGLGEVASELSHVPAEDQKFQIDRKLFEKTVSAYGCIACIKIAHLSQIISLLGDQSVFYINRICKIVHRVVIEHGGIILEQQNCQFLVFWENNKTNSMTSEKDFSGVSNFIKVGQIKKLANLAFLAFVEISKWLVNDNKLEQYEQFIERVPNYRRNKVNYSLTTGTVGYGVCGSDFKLSLKVIGDDVRVCKRMCNLAEKFNTSLITNQYFIKLANVSKQCVRKVGQIEFKDQSYSEIDAIYTSDLIIKQQQQEKKLFIEMKDDHELKGQLISVFEQRDSVIRQLKKQKLQDMFNSELINTAKFPIYKEWIESWEEAYEAYENQQWRKALIMFEIAVERVIDIKDLYPSTPDTLGEEKIKEIKKYKDCPPACWESTQRIDLGL